MTTLKTSISRSLLRSGSFSVALALAWLALSRTAQALNPPPDGGYAGANTAEGTGALLSLTTGIWNTALGFETLNHDTAGGNNTATGVRALFSDTSGSYNSATGTYALYSNINGWYNSAVGAYSLASNISSNRNTANGYGALYRNTAEGSTATGFAALYNNTTGTGNVANGYQALFSNTIGNQNTAYGFQALYSNTTGGNPNDGNTAIGWEALYSNTTGYRNVATGRRALRSNTTGVFNTANGVSALFSNTTGVGNTAEGYSALANNISGDQNTALGNTALFNSTTGYLNIALGVVAGDLITTGDNNIDIGNIGVAAESDTIRIGTEVAVTDEFGILHPAHTATYIAGISGQTASGGVAVYINSDGKLGTLTSSARFKTEIKPMDESSEAILALKPVTFRYKQKIDPKGIPQFGLVAEEVEKVNPDLVSRDRDGKPYTVRYEAVNAMLLNEFLKEHRTVQELKSTVAKQEATISQQKKDFQAIATQQQKAIEALTASLKEQRALIQKVSDKVELSKPAPQTVLNNH